MSLSDTALFHQRGISAWLVLLVGLLFTALLSLGVAQQRTQNADRQFELHVEELVEQIEKRLKYHEQILLGGAGLFDASERITRAEWHTYVERLSLKQRYPGIQGVGFSQAIPASELAAHIAAIRAEGFANYTVKPESERPFYTSIVYLEPFMGRNLAAFGYDMYSEPVRRQAMQRAVNDNTTAISGKVKLVQETHGKEQAGFLMYLPIYRQDMPLSSAEQRWQALRGFVYSPYRMDDLMQGILGGRELVLDFTLHNGDSIQADNLMYDSADARVQHQEMPPSHLSKQRIDAFGQSWTLSLRSRQGFQEQFTSSLDWLIPSLGSGISLSLFALIWSLLGRRERALALANEMSARRAEFEERFYQLYLHIGQGVVIHQSDGNIVDANPAAERILGLSLNQMQGLSPLAPGWRTVHEDGSDFPGEQHPAMVALREGRVVNDVVMGVWYPAIADWRWIMVDAYPREAKADTQEQRVYAVFSDITERKQAEVAAREQTQHTQAILDNMVDGIITIDQQGIINSYNPAAESIFGYTADEVLGCNIKMLMPNPHHDAHDGYLRNYQTTGVGRIIGIGREVEGQRKDGQVFPMDLAISTITRQGQTIYVGMVRDISERKRMERMKNEFISTVSHELRTPLTAISGALSLLDGGVAGKLPEQMQQMISIAHNNSQRLIYLINDLLDMEKLLAGKLCFELQTQPLLPLLQQAVQDNQTYGAQQQVELVLRDGAGDIEVQVDSQRLQQVLANLLSNAIKFSPADSTVELAVQPLAGRIRVSVTDHGPGIPAEFRERIFQKFSQADASDTRQKGGTGLGLAISRELVERMGGTIGFDSEEGQGATFYFELPLDPARITEARA